MAVRIFAYGAFAYLMFASFMYTMQRQVMFPGASFSGFVEMAGNPVPGSERVSLQTTDGETVSAWYRPARDPGAPVVLFLHGNGGGLEYMDARWEDMARRGWGILALSYRGYPGSTGTPSELGLTYDARAAYDWLRARHEAEQIVLHGFSIGTAVAVNLGVEIDAGAAVLEAPFLSAIDIANDTYFWLPLEMIMSDPFRSDQKIAAIDMPVLVVHGTNDTLISIDKGRALFDRAVDPKQFVAIEGGTHGDLPFLGLGDHVARFLADFAGAAP